MSFLAHFSVHNGEKFLNEIRYQKSLTKIANKVLERRQLRGSLPNFKTKALAIQKLKGKENCENEHRETDRFLYNFV